MEGFAYVMLEMDKFLYNNSLQSTRREMLHVGTSVSCLPQNKPRGCHTCLEQQLHAVQMLPGAGHV